MVHFSKILTKQKDYLNQIEYNGVSLVFYLFCKPHSLKYQGSENDMNYFFLGFLIRKYRTTQQLSIEHECFQPHFLHCVNYCIQILTHKTKQNHFIFFKLTNKPVDCIVIRHHFNHLAILFSDLLLMLIFLPDWFNQLISFLIKVVIQPFTTNLSTKCGSFHTDLRLMTPEHFRFYYETNYLYWWFELTLKK